MTTQPTAHAVAEEVKKHSERYLPTYGSEKCSSTEDLIWAIGEARGDHTRFENGHDMIGINRNSLDRIITYFVRKALHDARALPSLAELERDAGRYRWLRNTKIGVRMDLGGYFLDFDQWIPLERLSGGFSVDEDGCGDLTPIDIDAAIDAARAKETKP